ncbi:LysE family translocator [Rhizobium sp. LjRoot254]|uniref:LysE family translocator n=1 Tax=Rhizobium sp. LjRoot254 TaxID=3342297 RepID=UPI003ECE4429
MTYDQSLAFLAFAVVAAVTPGPSNVMITATGAAVGILRGLPCVLGASLGMASLLFTSQLGAGALITGNPAILTALNWGGAALLLWMSWKIATAGAAKGELTPRPVGFLGAAIFQWLNPKGWLVAVSAAGAYSQAVSQGALGNALAFAGLFFIAAFPSGLVWLVFGAVMRSFLGDERKAWIFNIAMGLLLAASVILMLV